MSTSPACAKHFNTCDVASHAVRHPYMLPFTVDLLLCSWLRMLCWKHYPPLVSDAVSPFGMMSLIRHLMQLSLVLVQGKAQLRVYLIRPSSLHPGWAFYFSCDTMEVGDIFSSLRSWSRGGCYRFPGDTFRRGGIHTRFHSPVYLLLWCLRDHTLFCLQHSGVPRLHPTLSCD